MPDVYLRIPKHQYEEGSGFTATAYFRNGDTAQASTTAKYRVDCLTTGKRLADWTSLTVGTSISISITPTHNAIQNTENRIEKKQLTVASDPDLSTQTRDRITWNVLNNEAF